jgi:hypothetical protein
MFRTHSVETGRVAAEEAEVNAKIIAEAAPWRQSRGSMPANTLTDREYTRIG